MASREAIEKVRQAMMRFRELLDITRQTLDNGERLYGGLLEVCSAEDRERLREKDLQWQAASIHVEDVSALTRAVGEVRFDVHELERAFEELHNIVLTNEGDEEE